MKRAKIMLIAIVVVATLGGTLAFKAKRFTDKNVFCATFKLGGGITCTRTDYRTTEDPLAPTTSWPCNTWHGAVFGLAAATTTSYYTTTTCPPPVHSTVYATNNP